MLHVIKVKASSLFPACIDKLHDNNFLFVIVNVVELAYNLPLSRAFVRIYYTINKAQLKGSVDYAECGVRSVENEECGRCGV